MANSTSGNPWILDTAAATVLTTDKLAIAAIRWVGSTTAGHTAVIQNAAGRVFWASEANAANFVDETVFAGSTALSASNPVGLVMATLGSGKVYVYFM